MSAEPELEREDASSGGVIVPDQQDVPMTLGLSVAGQNRLLP